MHNHYFTERVLFLLAVIASIGFYSDFIFQRPKSLFNRRASYSSGNRPTNTIMALSNVLVAINVGNADASTEEFTTAKVATPIHLQDDSQQSISKAITVEGVQVPGHRVVDGIPLVRNGHGLRSIGYFGIGIRIYVASMYTSKPILTAEQAMGDESGPMQLDFTFLRHVRKSQVVAAWTQQLAYSVTHKYDGYEKDRDLFVALASKGPIENLGTQTVLLVGDETRIIDQGELKGVISGRNFQKSFLSVLFGSMPIAEDLKANLLRGDEHQRKKLEHEVEQGLQQTLVKA